MPRGTTIIQCKDYKGKLPTPVVKREIEKAKKVIKRMEGEGKKVNGYILSGGTGLPAGAKKEFNKFKKEMKKENKSAKYLTRDQTLKLREKARNRVDNKNKNKN